MFDLKSLLKSLRNEVVLLIDSEQQPVTLGKNNRTNNFTGNIIYNENKVSGGQIQSSSRDIKKTVTIPPKTATQIIKEILIGLFITIIGGLILWYITTKG